MPVDRNSHSGVCSVARGSRITFFGIISGWPKLSLTLRAVSVQPAEAVYSPADNVVGIVTVRTVGGFASGGALFAAAQARARESSSPAGAGPPLPGENPTLVAGSGA